ncbi:AbrB/MazE/SpoVT family DNA-binding domain-containing protein [Candidatus Borrarchaeum sp.]|uniref:AbrB/MazE/SpoVT family DNA-binding domain-containing protein n=1 Tax=Candidatus Borrarchaeum sp. TaxID=2846742 RepID=UPI00257A9688|nr:AbrB/MazE/SpoVT family DNA-binding domain-containing protein [Candidatus Borrarchaeum sp.]
MSEPEITTISEKGQVIIPQKLRDMLGLTPETKLLVYGYGDTIIMKRLELPDVERELETLWDEIDKKSADKRKLTEDEILEEIQNYRKEK